MGSDGIEVPMDLDTTSVIHLTLRDNSQFINQGEPTINYNTHLSYYKSDLRDMIGNPQNNPRYGGFYTWFTKVPTDICAATNANIILNFLDYNSYSIKIPESITWLNKQLNDAANYGTFNNNFLLYYRSPFALMYMAARAMYNFGNFGSGITTSDIYDYIFDARKLHDFGS